MKLHVFFISKVPQFFHCKFAYIKKFSLGLALIVLFSMALPAQIFFDGSPGTAPPPATLGGFTMVPFEPDARPEYDLCSDVSLPAPFIGKLEFSSDLYHLISGSGWFQWSHGYAGSVYYTDGGNVMAYTLPANTRAFYFYAQPNVWGFFTIEAIGFTFSKVGYSSSGKIPVNGVDGAQYFGFYTDGVATISQIVVTADPAAEGFAVGEFGIYIGDPPPPVPLSNWALYLGILLIVGFTAFRFKRMF